MVEKTLEKKGTFFVEHVSVVGMQEFCGCYGEQKKITDEIKINDNRTCLQLVNSGKAENIYS